VISMIDIQKCFGYSLCITGNFIA